MRIVLWTAALLSWIPAAADAPSSGAPGTLEKALVVFSQEDREHPADYITRAERAWVDLARGPVRAWVGGNRDTLPALPVNDVLMRELRAYYMYQLMAQYGIMVRDREAGASPRLTREQWDETLRGQYLNARRLYKKSEVRARYDSDTASLLGPGWPRFQAERALARGDTAAAAQAYLSAWKHYNTEDDYLSLLSLRRGAAVSKGASFDALVEEGLRAYPTSPGVYAAVFAAYMGDRTPARLKKTLLLSARGQGELWPTSVDWKIRHAQALIANGKVREAESTLMDALGLLENEAALKPDAPEAVRLRHEIFALLQGDAR
jgi:hypothetical protein